MGRYVYNPADFLNAMTPAFDNVIGTINDQVDRINRNREVAREFATEQRGRQFQLDVMREGQRFTVSEREATQQFQAGQSEVDRQFRSEEATVARIQANKQHEEDWYLKMMQIQGNLNSTQATARNRLFKEGMERAERQVNEIYTTLYNNGHLNVSGMSLPTRLQLRENLYGEGDPDNPEVFHPIHGEWITFQQFMNDPAWTTAYQVAQSVYKNKNRQDFLGTLATAGAGHDGFLAGRDETHGVGEGTSYAGFTLLTAEGVNASTKFDHFWHRDPEVRREAIQRTQRLLQLHADNQVQFVKKEDETANVLFQSELHDKVNKGVRLNEFRFYANNENPDRMDRDAMAKVMANPEVFVLNTRPILVNGKELPGKNLGQLQVGAEYLFNDVYSKLTVGNDEYAQHVQDRKFKTNREQITASVESWISLGTEALRGQGGNSFVKGLPQGIRDRMYAIDLVKFLKLNTDPASNYDLRNMFVFDMEAWKKFTGEYDEDNYPTEGVGAFFHGLVREKRTTTSNVRPRQTE